MGGWAHLDELRARAQERSRVVHVLDDLHRTDNIEPPRLPHELLDGRVPEREGVSEARVRRSVARRDADVVRRRVDGERIGAETREALPGGANVHTCQPGPEPCVQVVGERQRDGLASDRIPPPHPTSSASRPASTRLGSDARAAATAASGGDDTGSSSSFSRMKRIRCAFILCRRANSPRSSHQSADRREK